MSTRFTVENTTCLGCGCACDDIAVVVDDGRIVEARNTCPLGAAWFGDGRVPLHSRVDGGDVPVEDALAAAVRALRESSRPLVYLAPGVSCEAQREAVAIADLLRARLDTVTSATTLPAVLSAQERGFASATLGEIRNRADVVVFWAVDVERRYPRFTSRYAPDPVGLFTPAGRQSRTVVAVDVGDATTVADADRRVRVNAADELATLVALQAFARTPRENADELLPYSGAAWDTARALDPLLHSARYVALVYDAEPDERAVRSPLRFDALAALGQALNESTRCAAIGLRAGGNRSGADAVLTAQTGYPLAVDFTFGYPRYAPHLGSAAACLPRDEVDVALVIGDPALIADRVRRELARVPCVVIGPRASEQALGSRVAVDCGVAGIHSGGSGLRADEVPLPLRPSLPGPPSADELLRALLDSLASREASLP